MWEYQGQTMDLVKCFIPLFVWLNVDVTNDMDICKFYPKFAQKRSHSGNIREKYFITAYVTIFRQRVHILFQLHIQTKAVFSVRFPSPYTKGGPSTFHWRQRQIHVGADPRNSKPNSAFTFQVRQQRAVHASLSFGKNENKF